MRGSVRIGKITAVVGSGVYTITQQRRNAAGNAWEDVPAAAGVIGGSVTDINANTDGSVDDLIAFWRAHGLAGNSIYACDIATLSASAGSDKYVEVSADDTTPGNLITKLVGTAGAGKI